MKRSILVVSIFICNLALSNELKPFVTDYCTMFADGTPANPTLWRDCCIEHDIHYWYGGSLLDRDYADDNLKSCVQNAAGSTWAGLIYSGVRAGHYSPIKNKYYWGWGWNLKRDNIKIHRVEQKYIIEKIRKLNLDSELIIRYIKNNF